MLWFIQHYLWDQSNAPDIRRHEVEAFEFGYNVVNEDLASGGAARRSRATEEPVVMVHDYHLYTLPAMIRRARPDVFLHHFVHIPWTQPDAWRVLPDEHPRARSTAGCWPTTSSASTRAPTGATSCSAAATCSTSRSTWSAGVVHIDDREVWVRAYPLPIDYEATRALGRARPRERVRGAAPARAGASTRSCASTAPTCPRTSCAASPASTSSSSSTRSSPSGSPSRRS